MTAPLGFYVALTPMVNFVGAIAVSVVVFVVWWLILRRAVEQGESYEMEPRGRSFEPVLGRYLDIARLVISLAVGSIALLGGYVSFVTQRGQLFLTEVQSKVAWPLALFAFAVIYLVLFMVSLARSYEGYLHHPNSYTGFWYALNQSLGFAALTCFALGYLALGFSVVSIAFPSIHD